MVHVDHTVSGALWVDGLSVPLVAYYRATDIRGWYEEAALVRVQLANPGMAGPSDMRGTRD